MAEIRRVTQNKGYKFSEIPDHPETTNIWNLDADICLWFSTFDARWRFMNIEMNQPTRRSVESFATKQEAAEFYMSDKKPTWTNEPLDRSGIHEED